MGILIAKKTFVYQLFLIGRHIFDIIGFTRKLDRCKSAQHVFDNCVFHLKFGKINKSLKSIRWIFTLNCFSLLKPGSETIHGARKHPKCLLFFVWLPLRKGYLREFAPTTSFEDVFHGNIVSRLFHFD